MREQKISLTKYINKGVISFIVICVMILIILVISNLFSKTTMIYIDIPSYPKEWSSKNGIDESHIKESIIDNIDLIRKNSRLKLYEIINEGFEENRYSDEEKEQLAEEYFIPFEIYIFSGNAGKIYHYVDKFIRKILRKKDIYLNLRITMFNDIIKAKVLIEDWDGHLMSKRLTIDENDHKNNLEGSFNTLISEISALISRAHHPIESVLYDYRIIDEYKGVSPWTNQLYTINEKEEILLDYANSDSPNSALGYLLLGNMFEKIGDEGKDSTIQKLKQSIGYYQSYLKHDTIFKEKILGKISSTKDKINNIGKMAKAMEESHVASTADIFKLAEANLIQLDSTINQLVIVTDPISFKKLHRKDNKMHAVHKAKMAAYERTDKGEWNKAVFEIPIDVNLSYNGLISEKKKREGDGCVPAGFFSIPSAFGFKKVETGINFTVVDDKDYWVSNPNSKYYNTMQKETDREYHDGLSERLANVELYEYAVVIGYNMNPIKKGAGSAIFIHIARSADSVTAGCISITKENLIRLIKWLDKNKNPHIYIGRMP